MDGALYSLRERAKELDCLYRVHGILRQYDEPIEQVCSQIAEAIPSGWQYPEICAARVILENTVYEPGGLVETPWVQTAPIIVKGSQVGSLSVFYLNEKPEADIGPFLNEEVRLIGTIADRLAEYWELRQAIDLERLSTLGTETSGNSHNAWQAYIDTERRTDRPRLCDITRNMLFHLCGLGIAEADLLNDARFCPSVSAGRDWPARSTDGRYEENVDSIADQAERVFSMAARHLSEDEIMSLIRSWLQIDRMREAVLAVSRHVPLSEINTAVREYCASVEDVNVAASPNLLGISVALIRRLLSEHGQYVKVAKDVIGLAEIRQLLDQVIIPHDSQGMLGGKAAMQILAMHLLRSHAKESGKAVSVRTPRTYYLSTDMQAHFIHHQRLDHIEEHKYKDPDQVAIEYPHIFKACRNGRFPTDFIKAVREALGGFDDVPLVVRGSGLLQDGFDREFPDVYSSIFIPPPVDKKARLNAVLGAIGEVYASTFNPNAMAFRRAHDLLDFNEEMGIMIQEVVGQQVGDFYLPSFSCLALSRNDTVWLSRGKTEDGLMCLTPGLGTRARLKPPHNYPVFLVPGKTCRHVFDRAEDRIRFSPREVDVIDIERGCVRTVNMEEILTDRQNELPLADYIVTAVSNSLARETEGGFEVDGKRLCVTFSGLAYQTSFIAQIGDALQYLEKALGTPLQLEFACDGASLYLLRCHPLLSS
jgi:hypothetical protein